MPVRLATLRAQATLDAQGYVAGASRVDQANARMAAGQQTVGARMSQTQARTSESARAFESYRQRLDPVYRAQQQIAIGTSRIDAALAKGQISAAQHAALLGTLQARYGGVTAETARLSSATGNLYGAYTQLRFVIGALGIGLAAREFVELADTYTNIQSRLRLVTDSTDELATTQAKLLELANATRSGLESTVQLYSRVARNADELNLAQDKVLQLTQTVSQAIRVSGTAASEASAGVLQFSQALASGRLAGDEFRSVMENMPRLAQAIAQGLGVSIGKLRELAKEQKLSAEAVIAALLSQKDVIGQEFAKLPVTVGESLTVFNNQLIDFVGRIDQATGISRGLASSIVDLGNALGDESVFRVAVNNVNALKLAFEAVGDAVGVLIRTVQQLTATIGGIAPEGAFDFLDRIRRNAVSALVDLRNLGRDFARDTLGGLGDVFGIGPEVRRGVTDVFDGEGPLDRELKTQQAITAETKTTAAAVDILSSHRDKAADKLAREAKRAEAAEIAQANRLTDYINSLEEEARLSSLTVEVRREEEAVLRGMAIVQRFLSREEENRIRTAVRVTQAREQEQDRLEALERKQQEFNDDVLGETADIIASIWERGKDGLDDTLRYWTRRIIQWLAEMAAKLVLSPIIAPIIQSAGLLGGALGSSTGGLGANFGPSGVGGITNLGSALGSLGASVDRLGVQLGLQSSSARTPFYLRPGGAGLFGTETFLSDVIGGALSGLGIGATAATLTGGNALGGSVGGLVGGALGSFLGPLGSLLGSAVGGFLGGLFGGKPSNATARINFDEFYNRRQVPFSKETAETRAAINNAADQIVGAVEVLERAGTSLNDRVSAIAIGVRDPSYIQFESGKLLRSAVGDPNALALTAIKELLRTAEFASASLAQIAKTDFGSLQELTQAIDFAVNVYDAIAEARPALTATEQAMKSLTDGLKEAQREALKYDLSIDRLNEGARKLFDFDIATQIQAITDPVGAALAEFERGALARIDVARELGADLAQVEKLNALERARIVDQAAQSSVASLKALINDIEFGSLSLGVSESQQYFAALKAYNEARASALDLRTPEAIQGFESSARALLPIAQSFLGVSTRFADVRSGILETARTLGAPSVDPATAAIIAATTQGSAATVEAVKEVKDETKRVRDEFARLNAYLQALFNRLASAA